MKAKRSALSLVGISYAVFFNNTYKKFLNRVLAYFKEYKLVLFIEQLFEHKINQNIFKINYKYISKEHKQNSCILKHTT